MLLPALTCTLPPLPTELESPATTATSPPPPSCALPDCNTNDPAEPVEAEPVITCTDPDPVDAAADPTTTLPLLPLIDLPERTRTAPPVNDSEAPA